MANSSLAILVNQKDALNLANPATRAGREALRRVIEHLEGIASGNKRADNVKIWADGAIPQRARGLLTVASASGAVGGTINGVTVTDTATGVDIDDAVLIAAAINASTNALVQYIVRASNWAGTIQCTSVAAGDVINILGVPMKAKGVGSPLEVDEFARITSDTATATSLAAKINAHPQLREIVFATSSTDTVTLRQWSGTSSAGKIYGASTFTVVALASTAVVQVSAIQPGVMGNCVTLAASGTGITASVTRLASGTGMAVTPSSFSPCAVI